jgi:hypothetical protein
MLSPPQSARIETPCTHVCFEGRNLPKTYELKGVFVGALRGCEIAEPPTSASPTEQQSDYWLRHDVNGNIQISEISICSTHRVLR